MMGCVAVDTAKVKREMVDGLVAMHLLRYMGKRRRTYPGDNNWTGHR